MLLAFSPYRGQGQPRVSRFPAEVVRDMIKDPDGVYVDGTFGRGGHTKLLLGALSKKGRLIAFDLDKTVLHQGHQREMQTFAVSVCQTLIHLATQRYNISAVTGNDLHQLSSRFMKTLVEELCRHRQLELLSVIHLFCNCAAVYICS